MLQIGVNWVIFFVTASISRQRQHRTKHFHLADINSKSSSLQTNNTTIPALNIIIVCFVCLPCIKWQQMVIVWVVIITT